MDNIGTRGMTPVVSKTLAIGLATLYIAGMTTALLGGVVPSYETRAGGEMSERVLATATTEIERAPPAVGGTVETRTTVTLPETIANDGYQLVLSNGTDTLTLIHPDENIERETRLSLPSTVTPRNSTVDGGTVVITVSGPPANRTLALGGEP
ncbi:DUF7266 family protein [Halovenus salina]|uniref:Uncharacterized protein n=1 Tax=Halovenus salina TaxID=1510225 RepID=A0ABD5VZQ0_9EURY|nr:hypothetical protein [Halovenus salina]